MQWSLFCRVVDNFGDIGFAWRLAADLAGRGEKVRLAVDDRSALAWMAPAGANRVEVVDWSAGAAPSSDVLVETFGCGFPEVVDAQLGPIARLPICINVEHLSAEAYVERSHGLPSPRFVGAGVPLPTWFFYPGFGANTGGLLREPQLLEQRQRFGDGRDWLATHGARRSDGERCVSLFCYRNPALNALLSALSEKPTLLLLTPGPATLQTLALLGPGLRRGQLRALPLPLLAQADFDRLLWSCDLNFVRGEDSLVRAIWSGAPFVWQAYPQDDRAQVAKLKAFLDRFLHGAPAPLAASVRATFALWNGLAETDPPARFSIPDTTAWSAHCHGCRRRLGAQTDLTSSLLEFVASKR